MTNIKVIGIGDDGLASLPSLYQQWINESELLIGGKRQLSFFLDYNGEKKVIKSGLARLVEELQTEVRKTVILASGDPLFYGIGGYLSKKINVDVFPNVSSIQLAFAKMKESWQDAYFTSLHGRKIKGFAQRIDGKEKIAILTDQENTPSEIAAYLLSFNMTEYKAFVAENIGSENERFNTYSLQEMKDSEFSPLNVVILKKVSNGPRWTLGIDDHEFFQRKPDKGLITKKETRVISISELCLHEKSIMWDIGACTGSVSIEAAKICREGEVYAIEKNEADIENLKQNLHKFRVDINYIHGKAPDGLNELPSPDAIFIGGTSGNLHTILEISCNRLNPNGRIVLNAATIETLTEAMNTFKKYGFQTNITMTQISKSKPILNLTRFEAFHPVYIISAGRHEGEN